MKVQPEIQDFGVPTHVFVNLFNDEDYQRIPLKNLDRTELMNLCVNFTKTVFDRAGYDTSVEILSDRFTIQVKDTLNDQD